MRKFRYERRKTDEHSRFYGTGEIFYIWDNLENKQIATFVSVEDTDNGLDASNARYDNKLGLVVVEVTDSFLEQLTKRITKHNTGWLMAFEMVAKEMCLNEMRINNQRGTKRELFKMLSNFIEIFLVNAVRLDIVISYRKLMYELMTVWDKLGEADGMIFEHTEEELMYIEYLKESTVRLEEMKNNALS